MPAVWDGEAIAIRDLGLDDRRPLLVSYNRHPARHPFRADAHYELELGVVCRGRTQRRIGDLDATIGPGEVWMCGMWEPHRYRALAVPNEALVLVIRPQLLADLRFEEEPGHRWLAPFAAPASLRPRVPPRARREVLAWARRMRRTLTPGHPHAALEQRVLLLELLLLLTRGWQEPPPAGVDAERLVGVDRAVQLVFERRGRVGAADAARCCGLGRARFDSAFAEVMGTSFARFALGYRLGGAAAQLVRTRHPLKRIARAWGFADASHLLRAFKRRYGCTPLAYRRARAGEAASA